MAGTINFTRPTRHRVCDSLTELAKLLKCGRTSLHRLREAGLIVEPFDSREACAALDAYNVAAEAGGRRNPVDVDEVRQALANGGKRPAVKRSAERPTKARTSVVETPGLGGLDDLMDEIEKTLDMKPLERKQWLEGEKLKIILSQMRGELLPRTQVQADLTEVGALIVRRLGDFYRALDPVVSLMDSPEERIAHVNEALRASLDEIAGQLGGLYDDARD